MIDIENGEITTIIAVKLTIEMAPTHLTSKTGTENANMNFLNSFFETIEFESESESESVDLKSQILFEKCVMRVMFFMSCLWHVRYLNFFVFHVMFVACFSCHVCGMFVEKRLT